MGQQSSRGESEAEGEAEAFDKVYEQYRLAPEVTRQRLYYETMERVLAQTDKTIVETEGGVTPYLPLPEIKTKEIVRYGFVLSKANWNGLKKALQEMTWETLARGTAEDALSYNVPASVTGTPFTATLFIGGSAVAQITAPSAYDQVPARFTRGGTSYNFTITSGNIDNIKHTNRF